MNALPRLYPLPALAAATHAHHRHAPADGLLLAVLATLLGTAAVWLALAQAVIAGGQG